MKHIKKIGLLVLAAAGVSLWGCSRQESAAPAAGGENVSASPHGDVLIIDSAAAFESLVVQSDLPVLVDFWATWCPPCRAMEPVIKTTASRHNGAIKVAKVDVDRNRDLAGTFNIRAIPTLMLYHQGKAIAMNEGAMNQANLDRWIQQQLQQAGVTL